MNSKIFYSKNPIYPQIEENAKNVLNQHENMLTLDSASSTRAAGDAIQRVLEHNFDLIIKGFFKEIITNKSRKAFGDIAFKDKDDFLYAIDVKTHRLDTDFNMPNLTSVERLSKFYKDDKNYFVVMIIAYDINITKITVKKVTFVPIEFLGWDCLTIGNLGWGQIQIKNSNKLQIFPKAKRKNWLIQMCDTLIKFYPKEILKIKKRIKYFEIFKNYIELDKPISLHPHKVEEVLAKMLKTPPAGKGAK